MAEERKLNLDPEMLDMFRSECKDNFDQAEESLLALEENKEDPETLNTLFRALHTIKGVSNMMGFEEIGKLAHKAEELAGIFRDEGVPVTDEGIDAILRALDVLKDMAEVAVNECVSPELSDQDIVEEIAGLCETLRGNSDERKEEEQGEILESGPYEAEKEKDEPAVDMAPDGGDRNTESSESPSSSDGANDENGQNENLEAFLFFIEEELPALKRFMEKAFEDGDWKEVLKKIGVLEFAAQDLGFEGVSKLFEDFRVLIEAGASNTDAVKEAFSKIEEVCLKIKEARDVGELSEEKKQAEHLVEEPQEASAEMDSSEEKPEGEKSEGQTDLMQDGDENGDDAFLKEQFFQEDEAIEIDDEDLSAFMVFLEEEYPRLQKAMGEALQEDKWDGVKKSAEVIEYAARQLELANLSDTLNEIKKLAKEASDERALKIVEIEKVLVEELLALKQIGERRGIHAGPSEKELSSIFVNRVITDAEAMNGRLKECSDAVEDGLNLMRQGLDVDMDPHFFKEAVESLRLLYHFCIFYGMDRAAESVLLLEDIYNRMAQAEIALEPQVPKITGELVLLMQDAFDGIREREQADDNVFEDILEQIKIFVTGLPENQVTGISKQFLNLLDVSPGFSEVTTPESNARLAEAFKKGLFFYEIYVDLDSEPDVAGPFMELSDRLEFITNETIYEGDQTKYNFLVASSLTEDEARGLLEEIFNDPSQFRIKRCKPRDESNLETPEGEGVENTATILKKGNMSEAGINQELIEATGRNVEDVSAISSTVHHVVTVLEDMDFEELLEDLTTRANVSQNEKRQVSELILQLRNLVQADRHLVTSLEDLQKNIGELVTVPTVEFLEWAGLKLRNFSGARGIQIALEIRESNTRLSRGIMSLLKAPFKVLINSCIEACEGLDVHPRLTLGSRYAGDSIFIEIFINGTFAPELSENTLKKVQGLIKDKSIAITGVENGFLVRIANCNAIVHGMVMQKSGVNYVVPVNSIKRILEPSRDDITFSSCDNGYKILRMEDELVSIRPIIGQSSGDGDKMEEKELLVVVESQTGLIAYEVDEIIGQEQLRVVPLSGHLSTIAGATGCAILGNGDVGIVLDVG